MCLTGLTSVCCNLHGLAYGAHVRIAPPCPYMPFPIYPTAPAIALKFLQPLPLLQAAFLGIEHYSAP